MKHSKRTPIIAGIALILCSIAHSQLTSRQRGAGPLLDIATVKVGDTLPEDLLINHTDGSQQSLKELADGKYTVIVSGCLTCPIFHRTYPEIEAVYQDYKSTEKVQFFYIYKTLAHPEYNGYVQPETIEERLAHIKEAQRVLGTRIPWISDDMQNSVRHALGFGPNTQILLSPDGKILHTLGWSKGEPLRAELIKVVGDTVSHSSVASLKLKRERPAMAEKEAETGILQSPRFEETLLVMKIEPIDNGNSPLYVKPRVEVTPDVISIGTGKMYLGFRLDPIHGVHWNNLAAPLQYELKATKGIVAEPLQATAPEVEAESDADPREFVLDLYGVEKGYDMELEIHYFACSDEEGWCRPVTQKYAIVMEQDFDGGRTMGRSFGRGGRNQRNAGGRNNADRMKQRILELDADSNGKLTKGEMPERMRERFDIMDSNGDGVLDEQEIDRMIARQSQGRQGRNQRGNQGRSMKERLLQNDEDGDGKLGLKEFPERMRNRFEEMDTNGDGLVEESEIDAMARRLRERREQQQPNMSENSQIRSKSELSL